MNLLLIDISRPGPAEADCPLRHSLCVAAAGLRARGDEVKTLRLDGPDFDRLRVAITGARAQAVVADVDPRAVNVARRIIDEIRRTYALPVVVVGRYATCLPRKAVSIPGAEAVLVGEYEPVLAELLGHLLANDPHEAPPGAWVNSADGLVKGPASCPADLGALPWAEPPEGDDGPILLKTCRGCAQWCAYCVNDWYLDVYRDQGPAVRRREVADLLAELDARLERRPTAPRLVAPDHALINDTDWLGALAEGLARRGPVPMSCHARLNAVTTEAAALLARAGCVNVRVSVASGSNFIRDEVFTMRTSREQIEEGFARLREAGLPVTAEVFVGSPYETEISVEETVALLRSLRPDAVRAEIYYPTPGTRAAELCRENGWVSGRGERDAAAGRSLLDMPAMPADRISELAAALNRPGWLSRPGRLGRLLAGLRGGRGRRSR